MRRSSAADIPAPLMRKLLRLGKERDLEEDIESVTHGEDISPDTTENRLVSGVEEIRKLTQVKHPPLASLVIGDTVVFDPDSDQQPEPPTNREKAGRGGNVPPKERRFKKGQSGNPTGRPSQSTSKLMRDLLEAGDQKYAKQIIKALVERACQGNLPAIREILNRTE